MNCRGSDDPAARVNAAGACMASGGNRCSCNESHHKATAAAMTPSCESCNALLASTCSFCRSWSATSTPPPLASLCFTVCCYYVGSTEHSTCSIFSSQTRVPSHKQKSIHRKTTCRPLVETESLRVNIPPRALPFDRTARCRLSFTDASVRGAPGPRADGAAVPSPSPPPALRVRVCVFGGTSASRI